MKDTSLIKKFQTYISNIKDWFGVDLSDIKLELTDDKIKWDETENVDCFLWHVRKTLYLNRNFHKSEFSPLTAPQYLRYILSYNLGREIFFRKDSDSGAMRLVEHIRRFGRPEYIQNNYDSALAVENEGAAGVIHDFSKMFAYFMLDEGFSICRFGEVDINNFNCLVGLYLFKEFHGGEVIVTELMEKTNNVHQGITFKYVPPKSFLEVFVTVYVVAKKFEVEIFDVNSHISYTDSVEDLPSFIVSDRVVSLIKYMKEK